MKELTSKKQLENYFEKIGEVMYLANEVLNNVPTEEEFFASVASWRMMMEIAMKNMLSASTITRFKTGINDYEKWYKERIANNIRKSIQN